MKNRIELSWFFFLFFLANPPLLVLGEDHRRQAPPTSCGNLHCTRYLYTTYLSAGLWMQHAVILFSPIPNAFADAYAYVPLRLPHPPHPQPIAYGVKLYLKRSHLHHLRPIC